MQPKRIKLGLVVAGALSGALTLLAWTQEWFAVTLDGGQTLAVAGQAAVPALSALGLASLALAGALSISGRVVRIVLGAVQAAIGVLTVVTALSAATNPVAAAASTVRDATGESGSAAVAALVVSVAASAWPWFAVVVGALAALVGILVIVTSGRWPGPTRKYEANHTDDSGSTVGAWDALSDGSDPTAR